MSSGGATCWYITRLAEVTPRPAAAALIVVHTIALAATCELPVIYKVLPSEATMGGGYVSFRAGRRMSGYATT